MRRVPIIGRVEAGLVAGDALSDRARLVKDAGGVVDACDRVCLCACGALA